MAEAAGRGINDWARHFLNLAASKRAPADLGSLDRAPDPGHDHLVAVAREQTAEQRAHALGVVDHEHETAPGDRRENLPHDEALASARPDAIGTR